MESSFVFLLILTMIACTDRVESQSIQASRNPLPVGSNVTISSDTSVTMGAWMFNGSLLVFIYPGGSELDKNIKDRIIFNTSTSSLTIKSAKLEDSGLYRLQQINGFAVELNLSVQESISNVTLWAKSADVVEFNDTAVFNCSVSSGSSLSYAWLMGNSAISNGAGVKLSNGGATLSLAGLTRNDQGPYRCNVSNGLGYELSPPFNLTISYGPGNTTMTVMPVKYVYISGSSITLSCSTDSRPAATSQWLFNEVYLQQTGLNLHLQNVNESNSGTYKCLLYNEVTMRASSESTVIRVMDPVSAVAISHKAGPAILNGSFTLQCDVTGHVDSIHWWKNGSLIAPDSRTVFEMNNKTVTFNSVGLSDGGLYRCQAFNPVSNMTSSPFAVVVNYGPMMLSVTGPKVVKSGNLLRLSCTSESVPPSLYSWYFNGSLVSNMSEYTTTPVSSAMSGKYVCMAYNEITGKNTTASLMLTVIDPIQNVQVEYQTNPAVEGHSYNLTCSAIGTVDQIYWMRNGEKLHPDNRTLILMDNMMLRFMSIQRNDTGDYQCMAMNIFENMTSRTFQLRVSYGPEMPTIMGPKMAKTGGNVTLRCWAESVPESLYWWHFNGSVVSNMSKFMTPTLTKEMGGKYTCMAFNNMTQKNSTASIMLTVIDPIYSVEILPQMKPAMKNELYNLTCNVTGPIDYIYWMKNGELLQEDNRTALSLHNKTVMFLPLTSSDTGHYKCMAMNALENMTSAPYELLVIYGPEMPSIMGPNAGKRGSSVTLSCFAPSFPPSSYRWFFNESLVSAMSEYTTAPLTEDTTGKYMCMAFNNITGRNSTASKTLTIVAAIKNVQIETPTFDVLEGYWFALTCNVTGIVDQIYWMKNGAILGLDNSNAFSMNNETVLFLTVDRHDVGEYQCMAMNAVGNLTSSAYMLDVKFGPDTPKIYGPKFGEEGRNAVFNCSATSEPPSTYTWWFNDSMVANTSDLIAGPLSFNMSGKYTCMAQNRVTGKNSTDSTMLTIIEKIDSVMIRTESSKSEIPINNDNFTLACHIVGPYDSIYWIKDDMQLNMNASNIDSHMYIFEKNMLHFTPLKVKSNGTYHCVATNRAAHHKSTKFNLFVNYGPLDVSISGPTSATSGFSVSLNCSADSQPVSNFQWFLDNQTTILRSGPVISFPADREHVGEYICVAQNPVTNITMRQTQTFSIEDHAGSIYSKGTLLLMGLCCFLGHLLLL